MMDQAKRVELIGRLSSARGASGFEDEAVAVLRDVCASYGDLRENSIRNLYVSRNRNTGTKPVLMLDAHSDEVGFMVQTVNPNGTLSFLELGRFTEHTFVGQRVWVRNTKGRYIPGIVASRPPHFAGGSGEGNVVDIGARSAREAVERFHAGIGEPGVPAVDFTFDDANGLILGKALDCRIGCAAQAALLAELDGAELAVDVVASFSAQEEVGHRGADVAAKTVAPDVAVVFEGAPADDTFTPEHAVQCGLGRGPMLRYMDRSMISSPRFTRHVLKLAADRDIPVQAAVRSGGGTDGASIHTSGDSVPTIVLSIPVRYIHAPNSMALYSDFAHAVELAAAVVRSLDREVIAGF